MLVLQLTPSDRVHTIVQIRTIKKKNKTEKENKKVERGE
jgi:hypothetical protein